MAKTFDVSKHSIVPKHQKVSETERKQLLEKYGLGGIRELPRILITDPAILDLKVKEGEIVKITRKSITAGETIFYRRVVSS